MNDFDLLFYIFLFSVLLLSLFLYLYAHFNQMNAYIKYLKIRIRFTFSILRFNRIYLLNDNGFFYKIEIKDFAKPIYFIYKKYYYFGTSNVLSEKENIFSFVMLTCINDNFAESGYKVVANYYEINNLSAYDMLLLMNKFDNDYVRMVNIKENIKSSNNYNLNLNF